MSWFRCSISIKLPCAADRRVGPAAILPGPEPDSPKQAASSGSSGECRACLLAAVGWLRAPHTEVGSKRCLSPGTAHTWRETRVMVDRERCSDQTLKVITGWHFRVPGARLSEIFLLSHSVRRAIVHGPEQQSRSRGHPRGQYSRRGTPSPPVSCHSFLAT